MEARDASAGESVSLAMCAVVSVNVINKENTNQLVFKPESMGDYTTLIQIQTHVRPV